MIIKIIDENNYLIRLYDNNLIIKDIYDKEEIKKLIKYILNKLLKVKKLKGILIFNFYLDFYNNCIIKIYNILKEDKYLNIKINFNLNNIFIYKIDFFDIKKLNFKNYSIYFYDKNYYLKLNNKNNDLRLSELGELIFDSKSSDIINKGILIT